MDASHFSWLVAPGPGREEKFFWLSALFLKYAGLASTSERGVFCRGAASFNNEFIRPCLKTFGASKVKERASALAAEPGVSENNGLYKVTYWVEPRA